MPILLDAPSARQRCDARSGVRFVLVHMHLFKNAGSTIDDMLRRNLGDQFEEIHAEGETGVLSAASIHQTLRDRPELRALSSHHFRYPLHDLPECRLVDLCFLRHPVERITSMFRYYQESAHDSAAARVARQADFAAFAEYMVEREPFNVLNSQTAFMATSGDFYFPPHEGHLDIACKRASEVRALGTVDQFALSIGVAARFLAPILPDFDWRFTVVNATRTPHPAADIEKRMADLRRRHGSVVQFLLDGNQLDLALWQHASQEVERRAGFLWRRSQASGVDTPAQIPAGG